MKIQDGSGNVFLDTRFGNFDNITTVNQTLIWFKIASLGRKKLQPISCSKSLGTVLSLLRVWTVREGGEGV